jgi:hypothetical protein
MEGVQERRKICNSAIRLEGIQANVRVPHLIVFGWKYRKEKNCLSAQAGIDGLKIAVSGSWWEQGLGEVKTIQYTSKADAKQVGKGKW